MRNVAGLLIVIGQVTAAPLALADSWRTKPVLEPGAPPACKEANVANVFLDFSHTNDQLSVNANSGEAFFAPVDPDGYVRTTIRVPVGKRLFAVELSGSVKNREMEVLNTEHSCRFKLVPVP